MSFTKPKLPGVICTILSTKCLEHIKWIKTVFQAEQYEIYMSDDNKRVLHCVLALNNGYLYISHPMEEFNQVLEKEPVGFTLILHLEQPSDVWNRATANGALVQMELQIQKCGNFVGSFKDPFGFVWVLSKEESGNWIPGVTPCIVREADSEEHIKWLVSAMGATVKSKGMKDGKVEHCVMDVNGGSVYFCDGSTDPFLQPLAQSGKVHHLMCHLTLPDPYPLWEELIKNGADPTIELKVQFWGGTYGAARDVMGLEWSLAKSVPADEKCDFAGVTPYILSCDCEKHIDWIQKVFAAEVKYLVRDKSMQKIMHCHLSCNGGQLMLCDQSCSEDEQPPTQDTQTSSEGVVLHLCLSDPDKVWKMAMSNGAEQVEELKQQFWGGYFGVFKDPLGVKWGVLKSCSAKDKVTEGQ